MDTGTLDTRKLRAFDKAAFKDPTEVARVLAESHLKVMAARKAREELEDRIELAEKVYYRAMDHGKASARQSLVPSVTSLLTMAHLMDRYLLMKVHECLRLELYFRGPVPLSHWQSWRASLEDLRQRIPNVHDYFLWRLSVHTTDEADPPHDNTEFRSDAARLTLRRDAQ